MRAFVLPGLLGLSACTGAVTVMSPPPPEPPVAPAPAAEPGADIAAQALAAGACAQSELDEGQLPWMETVAVGDSEYWVVTCERFAYQNTFEIWNAAGPAPVRSGEGTLSGLGVPEIDPATRRVSWLSKSAGAGHCGDYYVYGLDGALVEHRSRSCDAPGDVPSPVEWSLLEPAPEGTVTSVQNGDVSCYITLAADGTETTYNADFDLCDERSVGKRVRLQLGLGNVIADSCEGAPDCPDAIEIALATGMSELPAP